MGSPDDDGISTEETEDVHRGGVEGGHRVVISARFLDDQSVRAGYRKGAYQPLLLDPFTEKGDRTIQRQKSSTRRMTTIRRSCPRFARSTRSPGFLCELTSSSVGGWQWRCHLRWGWELQAG